MKASEANRIANKVNNVNDSLSELLNIINENARYGHYSVVVKKSFRIEALKGLIELGYLIEEVEDKIIIKW